MLGLIRSVVLSLLVTITTGAAPIVINFEEFLPGTILNHQYTGLTFSNGIILSSGITLNELEFPPHSGSNVASDQNGAMSISFESPVKSFGGFFTYSAPVTLQAFDSANNLLISVASLFSNNEALSGMPGSTPNESLQLTSPAAAITRVTLKAAPNGESFTLDDAAYEPSTQITPEPSSMMLGCTGLVVILCVCILVPWRETRHHIHCTWISTIRTRHFLVCCVYLSILAPFTSSDCNAEMILGNASAAPASFPVKTPTSVSITLSGVDPDILPGSVNLLRLGTDSRATSILGQLQPSQSGNYFGVFIFNEPVPAKVQLQISAAKKGVLQRLASNVFSLIATPQNVGTPTSIKLSVSAPFTSPGGNITAIPVALDADNNPIDDQTLQFSLTISPKDVTFGATPVQQGNVIEFPRITKKLVGQDTSLDPDGLYADTDPTDPNYGRQTGGTYIIKAELVGTSLTASADVTVLPTGTADITLATETYASDLTNVLQPGAQAISTGDQTAIANVKSNLSTILGNSNYNSSMLSANVVLTPPDGQLVTASQLVNAGFRSAPDDAAFTATLAALTSQIRAARLKLDQIDPKSITAADVSDLQAASTAYNNSVKQLQALSPSALSVTQNSGAVNVLVAQELPKLLDSIGKLADGILQQLGGHARGGARSNVS